MTLCHQEEIEETRFEHTGTYFGKMNALYTSRPRLELIFAVHETLFFFHFWLFLGRYLKNKKTFKASTVKITTFFSHGAGVVTFGQICVTFPAAFCDIWISFWQKISNFRTVFLQKMMFPPLFLTTIIEVYALVSGWNDDTRSIYTGRDPCR